MSAIKVAILGFGTVGEGVYRTIQSHAEPLAAVLGKSVEVAAILVKNKQKQRDIHSDVLVTTDFADILRLPELDVVIEAIVDKNPSFGYLQQAIERGCHIITANKEMFAHHGQELLEMANKQGVSVGYEATVAGGIPVIQTLRQLLNINRVAEIQGILNGTSNFILTEMREKQQSFAESLLLAQQLGYAEADPTNDVEGFDAFYKAMILSRIAFGAEPDWNDVERQGITVITSELIAAAEQLGLRFKHLASIRHDGELLTASVKPVLVGKENPFYHVEGVENAVNVYSDIVGRITLQGPGAGMFPTASAIIEDLVYVCQQQHGEKQTTQGLIPRQTPNNEQTEQAFWLIQGLPSDGKSLEVIWLQEVSERIFLVKAGQTKITEFVNQHPEAFCFPIDGDVELLTSDPAAIKAV
ncbi:homoserine dehydrogenase [Bacillus rubiinfantis]|uniref:homoserine dehydrogenase n=1 Tax=Bacillus rubiinfantis TaxID=1499680 RepID=UPI0005A6A400|nr:homoserine dehydrogenase [Bacillus rubiinfantis]